MRAGLDIISSRSSQYLLDAIAYYFRQRQCAFLYDRAYTDSKKKVPDLAEKEGRSGGKTVEKARLYNTSRI